MTANTINIRANRATVRQALAQLPAAARADGTTAHAMMVRCGLALLGRIKLAFVAKARGGADDAGESWKPLSPKTIAYSRRGGRTKAEKGRAIHPSQSLSAAQNSRWWDLYRQGLAIARSRGQVGSQSKGSAAKRAWAIIKGEGAVTLVDKYGHRQVEILRDSGLLLNSLSPGYGGAEQVFRVAPGEVTVGTNRKGARGHHEGIPGRLPQRRLWPEPSRWPSGWWADITEQVRQGILDLAAQIIRRAGQ